ncbi:MAG: class I SAM-dependent methyltransferase [Deltaproteobacteria bacterium]|nr:class I SAM-dependent methyltransferase [Deltaproteobacteria bacterium]
MEIDAQKFDRIARSVFAPVYPVIAGQIIARTGVIRGVCLDIGCGGGYLGAALARTTELFVHFFDPSPEMLAIANRTIAENGLHMRADTMQGEVSSIALPDASVNLVVSRGSIFFWEDLTKAFREIFRVLAPGGWAYIGGGFGSKELKESIESEMTSRNQGGDDFCVKVRQNLGTEMRARFETALETASIASCTILHSEDIGLWLIMRK